MKKTLTCLGVTLGAFALSMIDVKAVEVKPEEIANSTYVIGTHMFTREGSEYYDGVLTTDYIMLASQTINSNKLEDMTIYYKNPRGNWIDVLKNKNVEMTDELEITHKDNKLYVKTPVLSNVGSGTGTTEYIGFENGSYIYDLAINFQDYDLGNNNYSAEGYDVFEKNGTEYTYLASGTMGGAAVVEVEAGTKKTLVARTYVKNSEGEKVYSNNSNEIVLDNTSLETPTLTVGSGSEDTILYLGFTIGTEGYYATTAAQNGISGWELYEKVGNKYNLVVGHDVEIYAGETKTYVAKAYALNKTGEKIYSEYSNEITETKAVKAPTLDNPSGAESTTLYLGFSIATEGHYTTEAARSTIDGWELYEKTNDKYTLVGTSERNSIDVTLYAGETKTYVARAYALNKTGEKIYSEYSNEITESKTVKVPTLTSEHGSPGFVGFTIYMEGYYSNEGNKTTIDGWELYEKVGNAYNLVEGEGGLVDRGEIKTYVARAYALNREGEKVYSDYSNEYIADCTVKTPTLTAAHGSPGFVGFTIYTEGHYADELNAQTIKGWELYEKVGNNYNVIEGNEVEFAEDETRTFVARAYDLNNNNQKVYSNYSNEVTVGNTN